MYKVEIKGLKEFQSSLAKAPRLATKVFDKALDLGAIEVRNKARDEIRAKKTTYRGGLQQRIDIKKGRLKREIISNLPYSGVIETGKRGGGQPPSEALEKWAQTKLGVKGLGFVIARKIKQRGGIVGKNPFMKAGYEKGEPLVNRYLRQAHTQLIRFLKGKGL